MLTQVVLGLLYDPVEYVISKEPSGGHEHMFGKIERESLDTITSRNGHGIIKMEYTFLEIISLKYDHGCDDFYNSNIMVFFVFIYLSSSS